MCNSCCRTCPDCGGELVEVDNPMRREVRHRRGVTCTPLTPEQREARDERERRLIAMLGDYIIVQTRQEREGTG